MVAFVRGGTDLVVIVDIDGLIAVQRDQKRSPQVTSVCAQGKCLGAVRAVPETARDDELHCAIEADILQSCAGFANRGERGDPSVFLQELGTGSSAPFHAVN